MVNSSETWDFFICYKRNTAQDFAKSLKELLEEHGKHCFLDTEDIPAKFRGTDKWLDTVNQAVLECETFILIMTAGFDISTQIKREVTLARKIPNKLFVYFRHEDLDPNLKLALEKETLELGQQQQHVFSTENDLARKAYKILVDNQANASLRPGMNITLRTPPLITIAHSSAAVGSRVRLLGENFEPNSEIRLFISGASIPMETSRTNNLGRFEGYFTIPNFPGIHTVSLSDSLNIATTAITITAP